MTNEKRKEVSTFSKLMEIKTRYVEIEDSELEKWFSG